MAKRESKVNMLLPVFGFLILFFGFLNNTWKVAEQDRFDQFEIQSESLTIGKMVHSRNNPMFSKGGLPGRCHIDGELKELFNYQYEAYNKNLSCDNFSPYLSQSGFHAMFYSLVDKLLPFSPETNLLLLKGLKSASLALLFSMILLWIQLEFGIFPALLTLLGLLLNPSLTMMGRSLWFCIWTNYLPFVILLFLLRNESRKGKPSGGKIILYTTLSILFSFLFNGFEWISTTLIMASMPLFYYGWKDRWPVKRIISRVFFLAAGSIVSLMISFSLLACQIAAVKGKFADGVNWIIFSFQKRAHGSATGLPEAYEKQVSQPLYEVFLKYFSAPAYTFPAFMTKHTPWYLDGILFIELIFLFLLATWIIFYRSKLLSLSNDHYNKLQALAISTWISILAPFSWYIVFKGHAWSHMHINLITWFMPFCIFGFALVGAVISSVFIKKRGMLV